MTACRQRGSAAKSTAEVFVPPWVVGCVAHVLSQSEKRDDDHNVRVRLRMRECICVLTQAGGAVESWDCVRQGGKAGSRQDHSQRCTTSEQWQRDVFTDPHKCAQESESIGEADDGPREEVHLKVPH